MSDFAFGMRITILTPALIRFIAESAGRGRPSTAWTIIRPTHMRRGAAGDMYSTVLSQRSINSFCRDNHPPLFLPHYLPKRTVFFPVSTQPHIDRSTNSNHSEPASVHPTRFLQNSRLICPLHFH
jgi:hypothetical protein